MEIHKDKIQNLINPKNEKFVIREDENQDFYFKGFFYYNTKFIIFDDFTFIKIMLYIYYLYYIYIICNKIRFNFIRN